MRIKARRVVPPIQNNRHPASDVAPLAYPSGKAHNAGGCGTRKDQVRWKNIVSIASKKSWIDSPPSTPSSNCFLTFVNG